MSLPPTGCAAAIGAAPPPTLGATTGAIGAPCMPVGMLATGPFVALRWEWTASMKW